MSVDAEGAVDWSRLERLRCGFLEGTAGREDYWRADEDVAQYDATFAQRIGWKWDHVLRELAGRGWRPPEGEVLDWGCGSGIAGRAFLDHFGTAGVRTLRLWDRSERAMGWAAARARRKYQGLRVVTGEGAAPAVLLLSHVLTELGAEAVEGLVDLAGRAEVVMWVEPGTYPASLALIAIRERLRGTFHCVGPCFHRERCGILEPGNERHWCHHFAAVPPAVFTDGFWRRFGELAGIDLRSLPLSWLVLDRRPPPEPEPGTRRVLGRPRVHKGHALLLACDASGVRERTLQQRRLPEVFRQIKKGRWSGMQAWLETDLEITAWDRYPRFPPGQTHLNTE